MAQFLQPIRDIRNVARAFRQRWRTARDGITVSDQPAFDPDFEAFFRQRVTTARFYLEFGSGASTLLAARAGVRTLAVESDRAYAAAVREKLPGDADTIIIDSDIGLTEEWGYPVFQTVTKARQQRWQNYTGKAFEKIAQSGAYPDMILVDGRFRQACALAAAFHAQHSGAIADLYVDDYLGRPHYHAITDYLGEPDIIGRAAHFTIGPDALLKRITRDIVAAAHSDVR